jgi:hypothetical protein
MKNNQIEKNKELENKMRSFMNGEITLEKTEMIFKDKDFSKSAFKFFSSIKLTHISHFTEAILDDIFASVNQVQNTGIHSYFTVFRCTFCATFMGNAIDISSGFQELLKVSQECNDKIDNSIHNRFGEICPEYLKMNLKINETVFYPFLKFGYLLALESLSDKKIWFKK